MLVPRIAAREARQRLRMPAAVVCDRAASRLGCAFIEKRMPKRCKRRYMSCHFGVVHPLDPQVFAEVLVRQPTSAGGASQHVVAARVPRGNMTLNSRVLNRPREGVFGPARR